MDMKVSLESLYLKHFEHVGISIIYEKVNKPYFSGTGEKVVLDKDFAELYGVSTSRLNERVKI
jgi:hypothetical protein